MNPISVPTKDFITAAWSIFQTRARPVLGRAIPALSTYSDHIIYPTTKHAVRKTLIRRGITEVEPSWILEDNAGMRNIIETIGGVAYKRYRIF